MAGLTQARVNAAIDGALSGVTHVQLHDGDPGGAGTSNVAAGVSRAAISFPSASTAESEDEVTFTIPGAGGPYTHVSLWTASTSGTFCGTGELDPAESFAGAGTLDVTVTVSGSSS